jgi:hypothetical protein
VTFASTKETDLDGLGRVSAVAVDGAVLYTLRYDDEGRLARADVTSGEAIICDYDPTTHLRCGHHVDAPASWPGNHHRAPDRSSMIPTPLDTRVLGVIAMYRGLVPQEQLDEMDQLVRAGEPGVALENLTTHLYEYDVAVEQGTFEEIESLSKAMGLDPKYWARLRRA